MGYLIKAVNNIILFIFLLYQAPLHDTLCGELHIMKFVFVYMLWATILGRSPYFTPYMMHLHILITVNDTCWPNPNLDFFSAQ
jgi:hypothetical protein